MKSNTRGMLRALAHELANALENDLDNGAWAEIVNNLDVTPRQRKIVRERMRWTIIDEVSGENLLEVPTNERTKQG